MGHINANLLKRLETLIAAMGYELIGCETQPQGRRLIFRIYIDSPTGVTVEDCSQVSYQVSGLLDVEEPFEDRYNLEVSSPGIDRPLFKVEQYLKYIGHTLKFKLQEPLNECRNFKGVLLNVTGETLSFLIEGSHQEIKVPFAMIEKANLIGEVNPLRRKIQG